MAGSNYDQDFSGSQMGGFMNSPGISSQTNATSTKPSRLIGESSLLPVTIKQVTTAPDPEPDAPFAIDGRDSFNVTIVGAITRVGVESTNTAVTLSDGTDEIVVKIWTSEEGSTDTSKLKNLQKGMYVKVFGRPQLYRGTRSVTCYHLDIIQDSNEITLHLVEALYAHLMNINNKRVTFVGKTTPLKRDGGSTMRSLTNPSGRPLSDTYGTRLNGPSVLHASASTHLIGSNINAGDLDDTGMTDLEKKIVCVIKIPEYLMSDEGCYINDVFKALPQFNINEIKEAIQRLTIDGQLYTTIDEEHFKPTR